MNKVKERDDKFDDSMIPGPAWLWFKVRELYEFIKNKIKKI